MLYHTENYTTTKIGQCLATVIADTYYSTRITTLELVYPRYIHSELMTHRVFSRNASSSRATPIKVLLSEVRNDCTFFDYLGKNKSGMVAGEPLSTLECAEFRADWCNLAKYVANEIERLAAKYDVHKQTLNRALEPFSRIRTLVTATEWDNFFKLRLAVDAQPEMRNLALAMQTAMNVSDCKHNILHAPYAESLHGLDDRRRMMVSVAKCARVSYGRANGYPTSIDDDLELYTRLLNSGHLSPFEHVATAAGAKDHYANFVGWRSYRNQLGY